MNNRGCLFVSFWVLGSMLALFALLYFAALCVWSSAATADPIWAKLFYLVLAAIALDLIQCVWAVVVLSRRNKRELGPRCIECGYSRKGLSNILRCPECGRVQPALPAQDGRIPPNAV